MTKNYGGRPTVMTDDVLRKLDEAFSNAANITEACKIADIAESTFYKYRDDNEGYMEHVKALQSMPNFRAKTNVLKKVKEGDVKSSMWWLERKSRDEFATRVEDTGADGKPHESEVIVLREAAVQTPEKTDV